MMGNPPPEAEIKRLEGCLSRWMESKQSWEDYARALERLLEEGRKLLGKLPVQDPALAAEVKAYIEKIKKKE